MMIVRTAFLFFSDIKSSVMHTDPKHTFSNSVNMITMWGNAFVQHVFTGGLMILSLLRIKPMLVGIERLHRMLINLFEYHIALTQSLLCSLYALFCSPRSQYVHFRQSHVCGHTHMAMHERAVFEQHDNQKSGATRAQWFMSWPPKNVYVFLGKPQSHYALRPQQCENCEGFRSIDQSTS